MVGGDFAEYAFKYDALKRVSSQYNWYFGYDYTYHNNASGDATTTQIKQVSYNARSGGTGFDNFTLSYTYDDLGSIASVIGSGRTDMNAFYGYDIQGQLTSETSGGLLRTYTYDSYGNIRSATQGGNTVEYKYENPHWLDLLTAYDGEEILYEGQTSVTDAPTSGNPISYYNGTRWEFDWSDGRKLISAESADTELSFEYDQSGIRTSKTVDGVVHDYIYASGKLLRETITEDGNTIALTFFYDVNGNPYAFNYNGTAYYYVLNLQGDVIALIDSVSGATKATYAYDAWGNVIRSTGTIADKNPLRYRGYYYDSELRMYYLQSRYYDPVICRFINADKLASTGQGFTGYNMFAYCNNNPVCLVDIDGYEPDNALDTDGDGEEDCYVYTYTYTEGWIFKKTITGHVYFYTNIASEEDFDNLPKPENFNSKTDLMVADWTDRENAVLMAYQAQNIKTNYRKEIVKRFFAYTEDFEKTWERTEDSVLVEWKEHHRYRLGGPRAQNISFDEAEEGKGFLYYFGKAIGIN